MEKLQTLYWCENGSPVDLLSELFLQALPSDVRSLLPNIDGKTHQELSDLAQTAWNSVMAAKRHSSTVKLPIHQAQTTSEASIDLQQIKKNTFRSSSHDTSDNMCWYHSRFGKKARSCVPPCAFSKNVKSGHRRY